MTDVVDLNFLSIAPDCSASVVYAREILDPTEARPHPQVRAYSLPTHADPEAYTRCWVSLGALEHYVRREVGFAQNPDLARWVLFESLRRHLHDSLQSDAEPEDVGTRFIRELRLPMQRHTEGVEELILQPYYLFSVGKLGVLADFHFRLAEGVPFSRKVQQLSLSLNRNLRRNLDYYSDRAALIRRFVDQRWRTLAAFPLVSDNREARLTREFERLPAERLHAKTYMFGGQQLDKNAYAGLRSFGPLKAPSVATRVTFVFRETERLPARKLALALRGNPRDRSTYPGYAALFRTPFEIDPNPIVLADFGSLALEDASRQVAARGDATLPVLVLPERDLDIYFRFKSSSTSGHLPSQVCTQRIINDETALKWSVANIALQIFCKSSGLPWKVQPTEEQSLIIGISQSHKEVLEGTRRRIDKHFAFSVLTDSSGLFQRIAVLAEGRDHGAYLHQLSENLRNVLRDSIGSVKRVVLHTSFKLRGDELDRIRDVVNEVSNLDGAHGIQFAVVKINEKSRFFAINPDANSLVPFEGTFTRLGRREFLMWFEGIVPPRNTVTKAFPGPTHIELMRVDGADKVDEVILLQDLLNLSGANWRGFNARSVPVSVLYCKLVADFVQDFHERNLPPPDVQDMRPWFL